MLPLRKPLVNIVSSFIPLYLDGLLARDFFSPDHTPNPKATLTSVLGPIQRLVKVD